MEVSIKDLRSVQPDSYSHFFLDANVWLTHLLGSSRALWTTVKPSEDYYKTFLDGVVEHSMRLGRPVVVVTGLLLSEVFNTYMRISFKVYKGSHPKCEDFKLHYRPTDHYAEAHRTLIVSVR